MSCCRESRTRHRASAATADGGLFGVGITYSAAIEPLLDRCPDLFDVVEVEPQTLWIRTGEEGFRVEEALVEHLERLPGRKLIHSVGTPVGGVVDRFGSPSVTSAYIGAFRDERLCKFSLIRGGSDMQGRVTAVDVVTDRSKEIRVSILAARPDTNRTTCERERHVKSPRNLEAIT